MNAAEVVFFLLLAHIVATAETILHYLSNPSVSDLTTRILMRGNFAGGGAPKVFYKRQNFSHDYFYITHKRYMHSLDVCYYFM